MSVIHSHTFSYTEMCVWRRRYASSMLTAVQPWSGFYEDAMPVVWATAHITQFTTVGDKYLVNGSGSGELPQGAHAAGYTH